MNGRYALMFVGLLTASWLAMFGDKTPTNGVAEPMARSSIPPAASPGTTDLLRPAQANHSERVDKAKSEPIILGLQKRDSLLGNAADRKAVDTLFTSQTWTPRPKPLPVAPPTAPPLPFIFLGKKIEDGEWEVFLGRNDETFLVREKTVIGDTYYVESIKPPTLILTYLPLKQAQTLVIGESD